MIPATQPRTIPAETRIYEYWTPVGIEGLYRRPGYFTVTVTLRRSRLLSDGNTELSPDPDDRLVISLPNIHADPSDDYPESVRNLVLQAVEAITVAIAAAGTARGVL